MIVTPSGPPAGDDVLGVPLEPEPRQQPLGLRPRRHSRSLCAFASSASTVCPARLLHSSQVKAIGRPQLLRQALTDVAVG